MKMRLAVLRFKWKDQQHANFIWNSNAFNAIFTPQNNVFGTARYWQDCSYGIIDLTGSRVFPMQVHDFNFLNSNGVQNVRRDVIQKAIQKTESSGTSLKDFEGVVVVFPRSLTIEADAGKSNVYLNSGILVGGCLLNDGLNQSLIAHEIGHVLGFEHSYGRSNESGFLRFAGYRDQYCIMSAMTFNHLWSPFNLLSDPNAVLETGRDYNFALGPSPSCAMLYHHLPEFRNSGKVNNLNGYFRQVPQRIRLYASYLGKSNSPVLITVPAETQTNPFEKLILIEYRTNNGWDSGFASAPSEINDNPTTPAIVVHSIRSYVELINNLANTDYVVLEGFLPLPLTGDTDISFSGARDLGIQVNSVAPDQTYVDITIGSVLWTSQKRIVAQIPELQNSETGILLEEGIAENIPIPPNCGTGNFPYKIYRQKNIITLSVKSYGYIKPLFEWSLNGVIIPAVSSGRIRIPVIAEFGKPGEVINRNLLAIINFEQINNKLTLKTYGSDGNYKIWIHISCDEADPGLLNQINDISTADGNLEIEGQKLIMGEDYEEAVAKCWGEFINNLPSAPLRRKSIKSDFSRAIYLGRRFENDGIQIDKRDIESARNIIKELNIKLPALAGQLQAAFDIIVNSKKLG